jgi:hypothetical protein
MTLIPCRSNGTKSLDEGGRAGNDGVDLVGRQIDAWLTFPEFACIGQQSPALIAGASSCRQASRNSSAALPVSKKDHARESHHPPESANTGLIGGVQAYIDAVGDDLNFRGSSATMLADGPAAGKVRDRSFEENIPRMHNTPAMSENDIRMSSVNLSCLVSQFLSSSGYRPRSETEDEQKQS